MSGRGLCPPGVGGLTADTGRSAAQMQWARVLLRGGHQYRQSTEGTVLWIKPQLPTLARRSQPATTPLSSPPQTLYTLAPLAPLISSNGPHPWTCVSWLGHLPLFLCLINHCPSSRPQLRGTSSQPSAPSVLTK